MFTFVQPIASMMNEMTSERVLWDVERCELRGGRKGAAEDTLVGILRQSDVAPSLTQRWRGESNASRTSSSWNISRTVGNGTSK